MNLGWQKFMEVSKFSNSVVVTKHSKAEIKWKMGDVENEDGFQVERKKKVNKKLVGVNKR